MRAVAAAIALLALAAAGPLPAAAQNPTPAEAEGYVVREQPVEDLKAIFATVESVDETRARTRIGGTVTELSVDEGSLVTAGERIAFVHDDKLALEMQAVEQRLRSLEAQRELAAIQLERARELRRTGAASQARVDDAETQLAVAERSLAAMQAEREVVAQRMKEGAVLAPTSGRVLKVHVTDGTVVLPGEEVATIAVDRYILRANLPERHARTMEVGETVLVGGRGMAPAQGDVREGRVIKVFPTIEQGRVIADIEVEGLGDYFVGERVRVYVSTGARQSFVVPEDYLYRRYGLSYVRLAGGAEVLVQPGLPVKGGIEILSGLKDGDVVVKP